MRKLFVFLALALCFVAAPARAELHLDVTRGEVNPMPIAIPDFTGKSNEDNEMGRNMVEVITANLKRSGLFRPIDQHAFVQDSASAAASPNFPAWKTLN